MACVVMAYMVMTCVVTADVITAYTIMASTAMVDMVTAYTVIACYGYDQYCYGMFTCNND